MNITIIGSGKLARGLSMLWLNHGHNVTIVGHTPGKAEALVEELKRLGKSGTISVALPDTLPGEVIVLAVHYPTSKSVVQQFIEQLPGKILIDATNPLDFQKMELIVQDGSAAEEISRLVPANTPVVKAFNTLFASSMPEANVSCTPLDVIMASDDVESKAILTRLIEDSGLRPIDAGPLKRARQMEAMGLLLMAVQNPNKLGFKGGIKFVN